MTVSANEVNDMQRLINAMNGNFTEEPTRVASTARSAPAVVSDAADMKKILESFYGAAGDALDTTQEVAHHDRNLKEAMHTHKTSTGVVIGSWEVRTSIMESNGTKKKTYNVMHPGTKEVLFRDLFVGEAAHAIVRYLNKGLDTNHPKILEIADIEETFRRNRQDALVFKQRYQRCAELDESEASDVFSARHQRAKALAIVAQDQIKNILDNIR
jgi:hypothetical protein